MRDLEKVERQQEDPSVCIIGAGFSGLCAAVKLIKDVGNENFEIYEMNKGVGGTWFSNRYPGCSSDIPIHAYCYTFEKRTDWRAQYASMNEISEYLQTVSEKYDLYSKIRFEHVVKKVEWDTKLLHWAVSIQNNETGETFFRTYDIVVSATGSIRVPKIPEQFQAFKGPILHTALWDDSVNLMDKKVAVVGTGASGIQVIPQVSKVASQLYVVQRKPSWILPKFDFEFPKFVKLLFALVPFLVTMYQRLLFSLIELVYLGMVKNSSGARFFTNICNWHRRRQLKDRKDLYDKLTPKYDFGCQRTGFASDYYPVFAKPNTTLITEKVRLVTQDSLVTDDGREYKVDVLVLATGFRITDYFAPMEITDKNGNDVLKLWRKDSPSLLMGIATNSLPNLFILYGPNTSTGHNSVVLTVEMQMDFVINCLRQMKKRNAKVVAVKDTTVTEYMEDLHERLRVMVWDAGLCSPWYTDEKGRNVAIFPWNLRNFRQRVRSFDYSNLEFQ